LVLGLEPSCTAVFRGDATELLPEDRDLARLRDQTVTLAELLVDHTDGWQPGPVTTRTALAQVHCHQHAISGGTGTPSYWTVPESTWSGCPPAVVAWRATSGSPPAMGRSAATSGSRSCCPGRSRDPDTAVLADGFSCRTQIEEHADGTNPLHLAQLLAQGIAPRERGS